MSPRVTVADLRALGVIRRRFDEWAAEQTRDTLEAVERAELARPEHDRAAPMLEAVQAELRERRCWQ